MYYVYVLKCIKDPNRIYVGYTSNLRIRLHKHNEGGSAHTRKYRPWNLEWYCAFPTKIKAIKFETYLKSHSGKAFLNRRLV